MPQSLSQIVTTTSIAAAVPEVVIIGMLDRRTTPDWGDLDAEDKPAAGVVVSPGGGSGHRLRQTQHCP